MSFPTPKRSLRPVEGGAKEADGRIAVYVNKNTATVQIQIDGRPICEFYPRMAKKFARSVSVAADTAQILKHS